MAKIDRLDGGELAELKARIRKLEMATPLANASITRGRLRVASTEGLVVEGSAKVSGTLDVTGILTGLGQFLWNGIVTLTSTFTSNGPWNLNGVGTITGNSTQTGNMTVNGGGTIVVDGAIPMTLGSAKVLFSSGGSLIGYANGIRVASGGTPDVVVSTGGVSLTGSASQYFTVSGGGHFAGGMFTTTSAANVFIDSTSGAMSRVTSAARYKIDPQPMALPDSLLTVPVKDWIDRSAHERGEGGARVPGIIAEEVEAAGGAAFVTYDGDGLIQGVAYDRLALARTEILARQLTASLARIEQLEAKLAG